MMLDPNYQTSFENLALLARQHRRGLDLLDAYSEIFSRPDTHGLTQDLALSLEERFGGKQGLVTLTELMDSTKGLGTDALQQAMIHGPSETLHQPSNLNPDQAKPTPKASGPEPTL